MARIAGVNVPENKHIEISLTHIFGIGRKTAQNICLDLKIDYTRKVSDLSEDEIENIRTAVGKYVVEGDLRRTCFSI
jgi:small subunit ribosomal protein S13